MDRTASKLLSEVNWENFRANEPNSITKKRKTIGLAVFVAYRRLEIKAVPGNGLIFTHFLTQDFGASSGDAVRKLRVQREWQVYIFL